MEIENTSQITIVTQRVLLPATQNPQQDLPSASSSIQHEEITTSEPEDAIDYFRIWFTLDAVTIHRREIPGKESYSGFFSQMKSLFGKSDSIFDISHFEYVLVAKQEYREVKAEPFTGPNSYHQMRDELLKTESPWRHASIRQIMTVRRISIIALLSCYADTSEGLAALESYAKVRPTAIPYLPLRPTFVLPSSTPQGEPAQRVQGLISLPPPIYYWPPGTPFPLQNSQIPPLQPTTSDQQVRARNAPPALSTLPIRSTTHLKPSPKHSPLKSLAPKRIQAKKYVSDSAQEPLVGMRTRSRVKVPGEETNDRILLSSNIITSSPLPPSPLRDSICLKRKRVTECGTSIEDKRPAPLSLAVLKPRPTQESSEAPSTASEPMDLDDQGTPRGASGAQVRQDHTLSIDSA